MWVKAMLAMVFAAVAVVVAGCHHDRYGLKYKPKEECPLPPNQPRFDDPETATWKKPVPKKNDPTLLGGKNGGQKMVGPLQPGGF